MGGDWNHELRERLAPLRLTPLRLAPEREAEGAATVRIDVRRVRGHRDIAGHKRPLCSHRLCRLTSNPRDRRADRPRCGRAQRLSE